MARVSHKGRRAKGFSFERDIVNELKASGFLAKRIGMDSPAQEIINKDLKIFMQGLTLTGECKRGGHAPVVAKHIGKNHFLFSKRDREEAFVSMRMDMFIALLRALCLQLDLEAESQGDTPSRLGGYE